MRPNEDARTYLDSIVWEDGTKLVDKMAALKRADRTGE